VPETAGSATLTVVRTNGKSGTLTVQYNTVPVNASPGIDYTPVSGILTFPDGVTSQTIVVPVLANPYDRTNELVDVVLSNVAPNGGVLGSPSTATLTIVDTDPHVTPPLVSGLSWNGTSAGISSIRVGFNVPLLKSSALNSANFTLVNLGPDERLGTADDRIVPVTPSYDASSFVVTLTPAQPLAANQFYRLVISAAAPGGVQDTGGLLLAGNGVTAGTNYAAMLATGTNLKYFTPLGDVVSITIAGGGYLNDQLDGSGQGKNLTVVDEVPLHTVLTGTVAKSRHGTGRAYLGPTIFGLGKFGDVAVKMYSPPFQVDYYPFSPGSPAVQTSGVTVRLDGVVMSPAHKVVPGALTHSSPKVRVARPRVHVTRTVRAVSAHPAMQSLKASTFQAKKKNVPSFPSF
jgi:hypothetical protein